MSTSKGDAGDVMQTNDPVAALNWDELLEMQVASFLPYELHFFFTSPSWMSASRILEIGCGNGYFLSKLRDFFPRKIYVGIDLSAELIAVARQNPALSGVNLWQADALDYEPNAPFDVVVARLVVQHMSGLEPLFDRLELLLSPRGTIVIIEPEPTMLFHHPATPKFSDLLLRYATTTASVKKNRSQLQNLDVQLAALPGWEVKRSNLLVAPQLGPFKNSQLLQIYFLWLEIFERSRAIAADFTAVRDELTAWARQDVAYSQLGIRILEVGRR